MYYDKVGDRLKKNWEYKCEYKCVHRPIQFNTAACLLVYNVLYSLSVSHQVASAQQGRRCDLLTSCHTWANNTMLWMYNLTTIGTRCLQIETILSKQQEQEQSKNWKRVLDTIMLLCPALRFVFLRWHNMIARGADLNLHFLLPTKLQMTTPYLSSFQNWSKQRVWKRFCIKSLSLVRSSRKTHSRWIERIKTIMIRGWSFTVQSLSRLLLPQLQLKMFFFHHQVAPSWRCKLSSALKTANALFWEGQPAEYWMCLHGQ